MVLDEKSEDTNTQRVTSAPRGLSVNRQTKFDGVVKWNDIVRVAVFVVEKPPLRMKKYLS